MLLLLEKDGGKKRKHARKLPTYLISIVIAKERVATSSVCTHVQFLELECASEASRRRRVWRPSESMRNEGIMHPFTISHRRRHGIWPRSRGREIRGGAVESRASTGKVELKRIFGGVESVNRGSKRILDRLESSSSSLPGWDAPATHSVTSARLLAAVTTFKEAREIPQRPVP